VSVPLVLLRKELRQLAPLLFSILALGLIGILSMEFMPASWRVSMVSSGYVLLAMPALFSVGAGAMSVSQEKETKTIQWLSSLPMSSRTLIQTKLIASLIDWFLLWVIVVAGVLLIDSLGGARAFTYVAPEGHPIYSSWLAYWILNTFYLLLCGFVTSWWLGSSMTALIAFIPLAIFPAMLRFGIAYVSNPFHPVGSSVYDATLLQCILSLIPLIGGVGWLFRKVAFDALAPTKTKSQANPYASPLALDVEKQSSRSVLDPVTAMLWQFFRQNQTTIASLCGTCLLLWLFLSLFYSDQTRNDGSFVAFAFIIIAVCVSWMGVLSFQGDAVRQRIRFLADRGVGPIWVWLTRLLVPVAFACGVSLLYAMLRAQKPSIPIPVWVIVAGTLYTIGYSQWLSQLFRNPVLAIIVAPLFSFFVMVGLSGAVVGMGTSYFYMIVCLIVPYVATAWMMGRWTDQRTGLPFWGVHAALFTGLVLWPLLQFSMYLMSVPKMAPAVQAAMLQDASQVNERSTDYLFRLYDHDDESGQWGEPDIPGRLKKLQSLSDLRKPLKKSEQDIIDFPNMVPVANTGEYQYIINQLVKTRQRIDDPTVEAAGREDAIKQYQANVELLFILIKGFRTGTQLYLQEQADFGEIALIAHLMRPGTQEYLRPEDYRRYVKWVADSEARLKARRDALVVSWRIFHTRENNNDMSLGGMSVTQSDEFNTPLKYLATESRRVDHVAEVLYKLLDRGPDLLESEIVEMLSQRSLPDGVYSSNNPDLNYRVQNPATGDSTWYWDRLPGTQWFAGWEAAGRQLLATLPKNGGDK